MLVRARFLLLPRAARSRLQSVRLKTLQSLWWDASDCAGVMLRQRVLRRLGDGYEEVVYRRLPEEVVNAAADELDEEMLSEVLTPTESSESGDEEMQERREGFERWETEDQVEWMYDNVWG